MIFCTKMTKRARKILKEFNLLLYFWYCYFMWFYYFVVLAHQESLNFSSILHLSAFDGLPLHSGSRKRKYPELINCIKSYPFIDDVYPRAVVLAMSSEAGNSAHEDFRQVKESGNMNTYAQGITIKNSYSTELETAALEQMAYDSNFTEDINVKMRIPEKLTVDQQPSDDHSLSSSYGNNRPQNIQSTFNMEVPDRIVVSVGEQGVKYSQSMNSHNPLYPDNYASSIPSNEHVTLATPPRKLTLAERNMDSLEIQEASIEETKAQNQGHNKSNHKLSDSSLSSALMDPLIPSVHNESLEDLDDITMLRRQVYKLHRRITKIEKQETERSRREIYLYAITVGFWLLNGWFIYNNRRIY